MSEPAVEADVAFPATKILSAMLDTCKEYWARLPKDKDGEDFYAKVYTKDKYILEFKTIKLAGPRQFGHTQAVVDISKKFERPLVVVPYETQAKEVRRRKANGKVLSVGSIMQFQSAQNYQADAIIIDLASFLEQAGGMQPLLAALWPCVTTDAALILVG